ncbi:glycosyl hydrolase [Actinoplanes sp. NPDC051633]|uniref:glycoside hydrolase family 26 protein n=1 Tax=Actinoplanes sp. NPDC051633 TaxID=3155670 RepID=UPI00344787B5
MKTRQLVLSVMLIVAAFLGYAVAVDRTPVTVAAGRDALSEDVVAVIERPQPYDVTALLQPEHKYFGVTVQNAPRDMTGVQSFAKNVQRKPNMISIFAEFGDPYQTREVRNAYAYGALPIIRWEPFDQKLSDIAKGKYDKYARKYAAAVRRLNLPVVITFAHEMNGFWYSWGTQAATPDDFVGAWKRLHDIFEQAGATNVIWTWTPNVISGAPKVKLDRYWPGDEYVDWAGMDGYLTKFYGPQTFDQLFGPTITAIRRLTQVPILIVETGVEPGPNRIVQLKDLLYSTAESDDVIGLVYFNQPGRVLWQIDDNEEAAGVWGRHAKKLGYGFVVK